MDEKIRKTLIEIEQVENVYVFYACESGSRAWGFPSANSDYDVRFLYARNRDWYLSINVDVKRDVIERPIEGDLDINGWDLRKALGLLRKSNPPLLEWLNSPIVYFQDQQMMEKLRELVPLCYSPEACMHHYLHMALGNYREYLKGDEVAVKKYFYVLRPLLAIKWIENRTDAAPPMEFGLLVEALVSDGRLKAEITNLIERKKQGEELKREPKIALISDFIGKEIERLRGKRLEKRQTKPPIELLNSTFRHMLEEAERQIHSAAN